MASNDEVKIGYCPFMVDLEPYCIWDWDSTQSNLGFLNNIDPCYFEHIAQVHSPLLDGEYRHYAATALRVAYSQGLETLFALLCATAQAPRCIIGWMHQYENRDVYNVTRKIHKHEKIPNCLSEELITWDVLASVIYLHEPQETKEAFAFLWHRFAEEFLEEDFSKEYNSIKHGLRVKMGGFTVSIGIEPSFGVLPPPENMRRLGSSQFGTTFLIKQVLGNKSNFRLKRHSLNWAPQKYVQALYLISISIGNILTALKMSFGTDPTGLLFKLPIDEAAFDAPWEAEKGLTLISGGFNAMITEKQIKVFTKTEIKEMFEQNCNNNADIVTN